MKRILVLCMLIANLCHAQQSPLGWQGEIFIGVSGYNGDLTNKLIDVRTWHPSVGLNLRYGLTDLFGVRFGVATAKVSGDDKYSNDQALRNRNLNFQSGITEAHLVFEFNILSPEDYTLYPYIFGGLGFFHFNPYSYDNDGIKRYLRPLSTEGEGLPEYPGRKMYSLNQFSIPYGIGFKKRINDDLEIGFDITLHKLFTDYLDDVSQTYIDYNVLLKEKGALAAQMAFRQLPGVPTPRPGYKRGNNNRKDSYYTMGLKMIYHFQD